MPRTIGIPDFAIRSLALMLLAALPACSGAGSLLPGHRAPAAVASRHSSDTATGTPADTATGMPADTATGMPADTATGMPADTATGMPADTASGMPADTASGMPATSLGCAGVPPAGSANCTVLINTAVAANPNPALPAALINGLHPADLQNAYNLPAQNAGMVVAVVAAYDAPAAEADLAVYRAAFGLPACTTANGCFRKVDQRGQTAYPAPNAGWAEEISLDLDMVSAACPRCSILLVEANSTLMDDLGAGVDTAVALGAKVVSNSYYAPEWSGQSGEDVHYRHPGVAITAASGDRGSPSYPAVSPYVTAVGGTTLARAGGGWNESAWKYGGHGCSAYVKRPAWQSVPCKTRSGVDVAAVADPQTGVSIFDAQAGGWLVAGGTSVGAPLIAGAYALSGTPAGPWYSYSYARRGAFHPLTTQGRYTYATGLGSPNGVGGL